MADRRRIVPDNSVIVEALLGLKSGVHSKRARQFLSALLNGSIVCFAPDTLVVEFIKVAFDFRGGKRLHSATPDEIDAQIRLFQQMEINYVPSNEIVPQALDLCRNNQISPTDCWYLAVAEQRSAELWISHDQRDGFAVNARKVYDKVFTLAQNDFYVAGRPKY
jgi:predicted nucleic acid-binding protein